LIALLISAIAVALSQVLRTSAPWSRSIGFYLTLAAVIVLVRLLFRVLFNSGLETSQIAFSLKDIEINLGFGPSVHLLGAVSWLTLESAALDGLRLAAIVLSVAMANTLANPRRLLKSTPGALYEVATAISVAINLAPQLIESLQRVRRARRLRGRSKKIGALTGTVIPVLEDTLDRSLALAASMDARGFGRRGNLSKAQQVAVRLLSLSALAVFAIGVYLLLSDPALSVVAATALALGAVEVLLVVRISSLRNVRTRYRRQNLNALDVLVWALAIGVLAFALTGFGGAQ
jgi:energy-coupling factor transport system permease protein